MKAHDRPNASGAGVPRQGELPIAVGALGPLSTGLVVIYSLLVPLHLLEYEGHVRATMVSAEVLLAVFFLIQRLLLLQAQPSRRLVLILSVADVALPYGSVLLLFALDPDPLLTGFVVLVVIGCGAFFQLSRWVGISIAIVATTWFGILPLAVPSVDLHRIAAVLLSAAALASAVFVARSRSKTSAQTALARATEEIARREITERNLRDSETRLELAIRSSRAGWWDVELDPSKPGEIPDAVYLSAALKRLIGFSDDEFPNSLSAWRNRILAEDRVKIEHSAQQHLASELKEHRAEYRIRHRSGQILWMETFGRAERDSDGRLIRFCGLDRDITDTIEEHRALGILSRAVEQSSSLVLITDPDGSIRYVNPKFTRVTGYEAPEVYGLNPRLLKSGETPPAIYNDLWSTITGGGEWHGELKNKTKSGEPFWVLTSISPITDDAGRIVSFLGVQEDITERKLVEERLLKSQRLEAVGELVSGVAHDFNNMLTSIMGFSELANATLPPECQSTRSYLEQVISVGQTAASLTRRLLAVGRRQFLQPKLLDLNSEVRNCEELLRRTLGEDIDVAMSLDSGIGLVLADPAQLQQILLNLAINARDAMPLGGVLTFETGDVELDESYTRTHPGAAPGSFVSLAVTDTGCGMDEETLKRIFEPFFTTKKPGQGTGLGLATTYGVVKQSGGYIWAYSEPGRGSTFKIYLPRQSGAVVAPPPETPLARTRGTETILLVEDAEHVRTLLSESLVSEDYRVLLAADSAEALHISREHDGPIDLLITDLVLPTENGLTLAEQLRRERESLRVLLITGYAQSALRRKHALAPELPLLEKPFTLHDLALTVRKILDGEPPRGIVEQKAS